MGVQFLLGAKKEQSVCAMGKQYRTPFGEHDIPQFLALFNCYFEGLAAWSLEFGVKLGN